MILFSIPVHERQDIIHNHIENIFHYNPESIIVLHVNPTFTSFSPLYLLSLYDRVIVNTHQYIYIHGKGLLWIHIQNFKYALEKGVVFDTFVMLSSNELFFQSGLDKHIKKYKNGIQLVKYNSQNSWHNFHKNLQNVSPFKEMLQLFQQSYFYGGQAEGNFFEKDVFLNIAETYIRFFGTTELFSFETEEVVLQTLYEYLYRKEKSSCPPITLQNYSNDIPMTLEFLQAIRQNVTIENKTFHGTLLSPHIRLQPLTEYVYSLKRIPREECPLRKALTVSRCILNQGEWVWKQKYYCLQSYVCLYPNHVVQSYFNDTQKWLGWNLPQGFYQITGHLSWNPNDIYYAYQSAFFLLSPPQTFHLVSPSFQFSFAVTQEETLYLSVPFQQVEMTDFQIQAIESLEYEYTPPHTSRVGILLDIDSDVDEYDFLSFQHQVYDVLSTLWKIDVYIHWSHAPRPSTFSVPFLSQVYEVNEKDDIFLHSQYLFFLYISFPLYLKKGLKEIPFYINKINVFFNTWSYTQNKLTNDPHFILIPKSFFGMVSLRHREDFLSSLSKKIDSFSIHVMDPLFWTTEENPYYTRKLQKKRNDGFLLQQEYLPYVPYSNSHATCIYCPTEEFPNRFYFHKKKSQSVYFQWMGLPIYPTERRRIRIRCKIMFLYHVPILEKENVNRNYGLKIHAPLQFYNQWLYDCIVNTYVDVEWEVDIDPVEQFVLLIFDDYPWDVHYYIRDFHYQYF